MAAKNQQFSELLIFLNLHFVKTIVLMVGISSEKIDFPSDVKLSTLFSS